MARGKNDILWKGMLEEVFDDLLRFIFPNADDLFDLDRGFLFLDKEMGQFYPEPEKPSETRRVDKLVRVYKKGGGEEWVFCHVEVQGQDDPDFARRMFHYYCRIFDKGDHPTTAIALFTGRDGRKLPGVYVRQYAGTELQYKYNTLCFVDLPDKALASSNNPFALVALAAKKALRRGKKFDEIVLNQAAEIVKLLISRGFSEQKTNAILVFIYNYIWFENKEMYRKFELKIDQLTAKTNTMGIIEQVKQMKIEAACEETKAAIVKRLLDRNMNSQEIAGIVEMPISFVEDVREGKA